MTEDVQDEDLQVLVDDLHAWAEKHLERGACPCCVMRAMVSEGLNLARDTARTHLAKQVVDHWMDDRSPDGATEH